MDSSADSGLSASLTSFGRTNFSEECTVGGAPARVVMNDTEVAVAIADDGATMLTGPFAEVTAAPVPGTAEANLSIAGRELSATFPDEAAAQRFLRVLGVRKDAANPPPRREPVATVGAAGKPSRANPRGRYSTWMQNTLLTSTVLLALGWLNLIVGGIVTVVVAVNDRGSVAVLWLVLTVAGSAMPLCLGSLARLVVYRYELEDGRPT